MKNDAKPNIPAFIFARGGSKGIQGKNIRPLHGKPLIAYSIEIAQQSEFINRVIVSTDDDKIAAVAREYGAEVPFVRPAELASDDAPERAAWQHALRTIQDLEADRPIDIFVSVPTTSPLRTVGDLDKCIDALLQDEQGEIDIVITVSPAERSPYYNMVELDERNFARMVIPPGPGDEPHSRQNTPGVYGISTVAYAARPKHVLEEDYIYNSRVKAVEVPRQRSLDIDTPLDWDFAEFLLARNVRG